MPARRLDNFLTERQSVLAGPSGQGDRRVVPAREILSHHRRRACRRRPAGHGGHTIFLFRFWPIARRYHLRGQELDVLLSRCQLPDIERVPDTGFLAGFDFDTKIRRPLSVVSGQS